VDVELRGRRIVYRLLSTGNEHGQSDVLHVKAMTGVDGLGGLSPVTQCRLALQLSASLQATASASSANDARPSGVLSVPAPQSTQTIEEIRERWDARHGGVENRGRVAVVQGEISWTPVAFSAEDSQFLGQRELSAREVARIFRVPAWMIDAPTGDSLTYSNVLEQNRAFVSHSLRPWLVRLGRAISGDADLCPGGTYVEFDLDGLLRADAAARSEIYTRALDTDTGWMTRAEVRELEDLPPEEAAADA
jgi:HK97 family phage portal protein